MTAGERARNEQTREDGDSERILYALLAVIRITEPANARTNMMERLMTVHYAGIIPSNL